MIPCLDALAADFRLGLLSNGNGFSERCGLPERFRFVVFSQDVGAEKPDAAMFLEARRQAGCDPTELLHVGDSLTNDVAGPNGVGAVSVWLNCGGVLNDSDIVPDHDIRSLAELPAILNALCTDDS